MAIIGDLNELEASVLDNDVNGSGPSVEVVLDELFHGGVRALDHLFDGDLVHEKGNSLPPSLLEGSRNPHIRCTNIKCKI